MQRTVFHVADPSNPTVIVCHDGRFAPPETCAQPAATLSDCVPGTLPAPPHGTTPSYFVTHEGTCTVTMLGLDTRVSDLPDDNGVSTVGVIYQPVGGIAAALYFVEPRQRSTRSALRSHVFGLPSGCSRDHAVQLAERAAALFFDCSPAADTNGRPPNVFSVSIDEEAWGAATSGADGPAAAAPAALSRVVVAFVEVSAGSAAGVGGGGAANGGGRHRRRPMHTIRYTGSSRRGATTPLQLCLAATSERVGRYMCDDCKPREFAAADSAMLSSSSSAAAASPAVADATAPLVTGYSLPPPPVAHGGGTPGVAAPVPAVAVVHISRVTHDAARGPRCNDARVSVRLTEDLAACAVRDAGGELVPELGSSGGGRRLWGLRAAVMYSGDATRGHYTTISRNRRSGEWALFDFDTVTRLSQGAVDSLLRKPHRAARERPYLLFFEELPESPAV